MVGLVGKSSRSVSDISTAIDGEFVALLLIGAAQNLRSSGNAIHFLAAGRYCLHIEEQ